MKNKWIIAFILLCFLLPGCTATVLQRPNTDIIPQLMENTKKLAKVSDFSLTYMKHVLGNDMGTLPAEVVECMNSILETVKQVQEKNRDYTNEELALIAGKWDRIIYLTGLPAIKNIIKLINSGIVL